MGTIEDLDLLKAAIALACADGELRRSEMGVIKGLAARVGVGQMSFDAMVAAAGHDDSAADNILIGSPRRARQAFELLVAQARIDGEISNEERSVLVRIASSLNISGNDFQDAYQEGLRRADEIRKARRGEV